MVRWSCEPLILALSPGLPTGTDTDTVALMNCLPVLFARASLKLNSESTKKELEKELDVVNQIQGKLGGLKVTDTAATGLKAEENEKISQQAISLQNGADASDALAKFGEEPQGPPDGKFSPAQQEKYGINADGNVLDSGKLKQATDTDSASNEATAPAPPAPREQAQYTPVTAPSTNI